MTINMINALIKTRNLVLFSSVTLLLGHVLLPKYIYDIKLKNINGGNIDLQKFKGKKMVFITVSGNESDSALGYLSAFCKQYKDSVEFIGVLSFEDGFSENNKQEVKKRFKEFKKLDIELTEGMNTKKTSANQSELMRWLTRKEQNQHFDNDVMVGQKFFVDESGVLYAVIGPRTSLSDPVIARILSRPKRL